MTLELNGKMRSTPWPKLTLRTVKLPPGPLRREMTVPSNACTRSLSPSLIFTWTRTVSPGLMAGRSLRCSLAASFSMMGCCDMTFSSSLKDDPTSINFKFQISNLKFSIPFSRAQLGEQSLVFLTQRLVVQQVRPVTQCLFQRFAPAPLANLLVVSADQHFRRRHPAKLCRPRIVRIVQQSAAGAGAVRTDGLRIRALRSELSRRRKTL